MNLDILLVAVFLLCAFIGYRRGFMRTLSHTLGWVAAIVAAAFVASPLQSFLKENTTMTEYFSSEISDALSENTDGFIASLSGISDVLASGTKSATDKAIDVASESMADACVLVLSFLAIFIAVKLVIFIITWIVQRKNKDNFIGATDRVLGMTIGAVTGALLAIMIGTFILPVTGMFAPNMLEKVQAAMDDSFITNAIYKLNIIDLFLPSDITDITGGVECE